VYTFIDRFIYIYWQICIPLLTDIYTFIDKTDVYTFIDRFVYIY